MKQRFYETHELGQATTEYILLLSVVVSFYMIVISGMNRFNLGQKLTKFMTQSFTATYTYGHPQAKGFDNGGPIYHPRAVGCENCFRIFLNSSDK